MRSRRFTKRIEFWQTSNVPDGFGGNTEAEELITSSWAFIKSAGINSKYTSRATDIGITNTTDSIIIRLRKRNDITYNSINQFIKYRGKKYIVQNEPVNIDFNDAIIEIIATREETKEVTEIAPI